MDFDFLKHFPQNYNPRPQQIEALKKIREIFESGKKYAIGCLPTGIGKSHIARAVADAADPIPDALKEIVERYEIHMPNTDWQKKFLEYPIFGSYILTITKQLQDQYDSIFGLNSVKGKSNYMCEIDNQFGVDFAPCIFSQKQKRECFHQDICSYYKARNRGVIENSTVLNYSLYLNLPQQLKLRQIIVMDEAADLEDELVGKYTLNLNFKHLKMEGVSKSAIKTDDREKAETWLTEIYDTLYKILEDSIQTAHSSHSVGGMKSINPSIIKKINRLKTTIADIENVLSYWDSCEYLVELDGKEGVVFTPYDIKPLAKELFSNADHILMMSATLTNPKEYAKSLGIEKDEYVYFEIPSLFDPKKSPIISSRKYKLSYKNMDKVLPEVIKETIKICENHPNEKGLIHTHSNVILRALQKELARNPRFIFRDEGRTNEMILEDHKNSKEPTVLVSPSMDTGVSLDGELGRFQIIMKAPYLPLGSKRIKRMFEENKTHYTAKMLDNVVQMCGRCTRSENDYSVTYIVDGTLTNAILRDKDTLPKYFLERFV